MTGDGSCKWAYLEEGQVYYYAPDENSYIALKRVGNLTFLEGEVTKDGKKRKEENRGTVQQDTTVGGENQGQGC